MERRDFYLETMIPSSSSSSSSSAGQAYVLYVDQYQHPAPLSDCFVAATTTSTVPINTASVSTDGSSLSSRQQSVWALSTSIPRFPKTTTTRTVDSAYCGQCLKFYDASTAVTTLGNKCPQNVTCQQCPLCLAAVTPTVKMTLSDSRVYYYHCNVCQWHSQHSCSVSTDSLSTTASTSTTARDLATLAVALERARDHNDNQNDPRGSYAADVQAHFASCVQAWSTMDSLKRGRQLSASTPTTIATPPSIVPLTMQDTDITTDTLLPCSVSDGALSTIAWQMQPCVVRRRQHDRNVALSSKLLPLPTTLRFRWSLRSVPELEESRPGILVKPKLNPLEGDSSLRTGHTQWWKKDASALHVVPNMEVVGHGMSRPSELAVLVRLTNPTLTSLAVRLVVPHAILEAKNAQPTNTRTFPDVLLDRFSQIQSHVQIHCDSAQHSSDGGAQLNDGTDAGPIVLTSAEDAFLALGTSMTLPAAVAEWNPEKAAASMPTTATSARASLVAHDQATMWYQVCWPESLVQASETGLSTAAMAIPLTLQSQPIVSTDGDASGVTTIPKEIPASWNHWNLWLVWSDGKE